MSNEELIQLLILAVGAIIIIVFVLIIILGVMNAREKKQRKKEEEAKWSSKQVKKSQIIYTPESILDFMNFERIEDNMIIQKNDKFLMIVECQGINYDLMSEMEKASVEQGFISFLNTLRHPVQLYIQTRTINLERSVEGYKSRLRDIERKTASLEIEYENILKNPKSSKTEIEKVKYELIKQRNLQEYTDDIIRDIEKQSLNRNILSKRYYVIVPCYKSEIADGDFDESEVKNMAFSELYTRARAVINSLFSCQVTGKILNSEEITELLYIAYNRDESDLFWMEKMKKAGFDELYSTAPDVMEKKLKLLDKQIEEASISLANKKIGEARKDKELHIIEKERNKEEIINRRAKELIRKHKKYIGEDIAQSAINKLDNIENENKVQEKGKEELNNVNVQEKGKRGRPRSK